MAVYVDDAYIPAEVPNGTRSHASQWCHLTADRTDELIAFARSIGLQRTWIQHPGTSTEHFDLTLGKRAQAVASGAIEITRDEAAAQVEARAQNVPFDLTTLRAEEPRMGSSPAPEAPTDVTSWHTLTLW